MEADLAKRLRLKLGSTVAFSVNDKTVPATVAAFFHNDGEHVNARSEFVLSRRMPCRGCRQSGTQQFMLTPLQVGQVQAALFANFPTVTVINIADVIETIQGVVRQITLVIRFPSWIFYPRRRRDPRFEHC